MSLYVLQKMLREINRRPEAREAYLASPQTFVQGFDLEPEERDAVVSMDITRLYAMGVHGLILRPFTLLHRMPEPEYLQRIRGERP
jgi:hypothetical protein